MTETQTRAVWKDALIKFVPWIALALLILIVGNVILWGLL
jgi:prepilin signal peptidase PulO-like enzyme (type II secretory pathway)